MIMIRRQHSLLRRFLLAAILTVGFGTLWAALVMWLGTAIFQALPGKSHPPLETLVITADGTPLVQSVPLDNLSLVTFRDLHGRPRGSVARNDQLQGVFLSGGSENVPQSDWPRRIRVFMDEREPAAVWYFVHDGRPEGSGEFVGYERNSNRLIGHIGLAGLRTHPVPPGERIPVKGALAADYSPWSSAHFTIHSGRLWVPQLNPWDVPPRLVHVPSGNRLQLVDLGARTVRTIFDAPAPIVSVGVPNLSSQSLGQSRKEQPILVRSGPTVYRLDHTYNVVGTFALPADLDRQSVLAWYEVDGGRAIVVATTPPGIETGVRDGVQKQTVYRIAGDGTVQESTELALQVRQGGMSTQERGYLLAAGLPAPAAQLAEGLVMAAGDSRAAIREMLRRSWPTLLAVLAVSSALAAAAWRRARAFGLSGSEPAAWAAFVLLLGVPGWAGFLLHRRWPVLEPCPHCHERSPRDRDTCSECGTPFPAPALTGTEIFA